MKYKMSSVLLCFFTIFSHIACASVVMTGTRVIFPSTVTEKTVQFKNSETQPFVVQLQMTKENGEPNDTAPFSLVPPVFRMESQSGQSVRLIYSGKSLPQDKESVFYLDFTQLPALKASEKTQNQLIIAIRNRVKVFYRPASLDGLQSEAYNSLIFTIKNGKLNVQNPSGFYISIRKAELQMNGQSFHLADSVMLSPKSNEQWPLSKKITTLRNAKLKLLLVNDYGVDIKRERHL